MPGLFDALFDFDGELAALGGKLLEHVERLAREPIESGVFDNGNAARYRNRFIEAVRILHRPRLLQALLQIGFLLPAGFLQVRAAVATEALAGDHFG